MKNIILISIFLFLVSCSSSNYKAIWTQNPKYNADIVGLRNIMVDLPANSKIVILDIPAESREAMEIMLEKAGFKIVRKVEPQHQEKTESQNSYENKFTLEEAEAILGKTSFDIAKKLESQNLSNDPISIGKSLGADVVIVGKTELEGFPGSRLTLRAIKVENGALISLSRTYASEFFTKSKENLPYVLGFIDSRDGQVYSVNRIGNMIWMSQNLNYEAGGTSKCIDDDVANCKSYYGRLYKWEDAQGVCPNGWRLPSKAEWTDMVDSAAARYNDTTSRFSFVIDYDIAGNYSFWSSSETSKSKASYVYMTDLVWTTFKDRNKIPRKVFHNEEKKTSYFSVRCIANL